MSSTIVTDKINLYKTGAYVRDNLHKSVWGYNEICIGRVALSVALNGMLLVYIDGRYVSAYEDTALYDEARNYIIDRESDEEYKQDLIDSLGEGVNI